MSIQRFTEADTTAIWELLNRLTGDVETLIGNRLPEWQQYTPSWTDGSQAIGLATGTLTGAYTRVRSTVIGHVLLTRVAASGIGAGNWTFGLPVPPASFRAVEGSGTITGNGKSLPVTVVGIGSNAVGLMVPAGRVSNALPGTWGAEIVAFGFTYQVA